MASNLNVILAGLTIQVVQNTDSTTRVSSSAGNPTLTAAVSEFIDYLPVLAIGSALTLPAATIWVLYIRNLGGLNSSPAGNITVQTQVTGGTLPTAANSAVISPLGVYSVWNTAEAGNGIIGVTLVASVNLTPVEILMAA